MNSPHDAGAKPRPHPQRTDAPNKPSYYDSLPIPVKLLDTLHRAPLAIGIYIVVCRLFLINGGKPVPLSDHDLILIDASLSRGAIIRAITHLVNGGWLIKHTDQFKTHYTPAWGMINGAPRAWSLDEPSLGKPKHVRTLRFEMEPLNNLGKIAPHATQPTRVVRYPDTTDPITLRDIGTMVLNRPVTPKTRPSQSAAAPDTALAEAEAAPVAPVEPAPAALAEPMPTEPAPVAPAEPAPTPLTGTGAVPPPVPVQRSGAIIVLHAMIWSLIGTILVSLILKLTRLKTQCECALSALQDVQATFPTAHEINGISPTRTRSESDEQIPPSHPVIGGGGYPHDSKTSGAPEPPTSAQPDEPEGCPETTEQQHTVAHPTKKRHPSTPEPATPAYRLLRELHINPNVCRELAGLPADLVEDVIALAYDNDVHSVPGWVVAVLRQKKADIAAGVPPVTRPQRSRFSLFDALADDTPAVPAEPCDRPNVPAEAHQDASQDGAEPAEPPQNTVQAASSKPAQRQNDDPSVLLEHARAAGDLDAAWAIVLDQLRYRIPRSEYDLIARASLRHWTEKEAVIACRDLPHKQQVEDKFIPVLRDVLGVTRIVCLIRS